MTKQIDIKKIKNKRESSKDLALEPSETQKLLDELYKAKHRIIFILGAYGGLRVQEIAQCRREWLNFKDYEGKRTLHIDIPKQTRDTRNKYALWNPKRYKDRTAIIFDSVLANEVMRWFDENKDGLQMSRQNITQNIVQIHFSKIIDRHLTTHALRSTYQNYLNYELNFDMKAIAVLMGHTDIRTTAKHYDSMNKASVEMYLMNKFKNNQ